MWLLWQTIHFTGFSISQRSKHNKSLETVWFSFSSKTKSLGFSNVEKRYSSRYIVSLYVWWSSHSVFSQNARLQTYKSILQVTDYKFPLAFSCRATFHTCALSYTVDLLSFYLFGIISTKTKNMSCITCTFIKVDLSGQVDIWTALHLITKTVIRSTETQITTLYKCAEQKSLAKHTACQSLWQMSYSSTSIRQEEESEASVSTSSLKQDSWKL